MTIYTDGGAHNHGDNKGIGAWAFTEFNDTMEYTYVVGGFVNNTTNNRTEMLAVINAIKFNPGQPIQIIADSGYVVKGYNHPSYLDTWIKNGWKTSSRKPVVNQDLWQELYTLSFHNGFKFRLIRGHYKDPDPVCAFWNAIVDRACTKLMQEYRNIPHNKVIFEFNLKTRELKEMAIL